MTNNVLGADAQWDITGAAGSSVSCGRNQREFASQRIAKGHLRLHGGSFVSASGC